MVSGSTLWSLGQNVVDGFMYILGIFLICFASVIIGGLTYTFFYVILPMIERANPENWLIPHVHVVIVVFLLSNIISNYVLCITTKHKGPMHEKIVRELAEATGILYPEGPEDVEQFKSDFQQKMLYRIERRRVRREQQEAAANTPATPSGESTVVQRKNATTDTSSDANKSAGQQTQPAAKPKKKSLPPKIRSWMIMGPNEWGFCDNSNQPKPPRSHFDHVTKQLVLNMDHYCPWMFNTVGYLNYRYFYNFLLFVFIGMMYGVSITFRPFFSSHGAQYREQIKLSRQQHSKEVLHMFDYIPIPTQTTIEFHGNCANRRRAKKLKKKYTNPHDLGMKRNFQQVYGTGNPLLAMIVPSSREPEFLPLPIPGRKGLRPQFGGKIDDDIGGPNIV